MTKNCWVSLKCVFFLIAGGNFEEPSEKWSGLPRSYIIMFFESCHKKYALKAYSTIFCHKFSLLIFFFLNTGITFSTFSAHR